VRGEAGGEDERQAIATAIRLGERGRRNAPPNPWVGCLLTRDGEVIGEGFHVRPGEPHAEAVALSEAGDRARGATAYVTLEPCAHHGRTPPCADALITAGVARVVVALDDPDPHVAGEGIARLRSSGVDVEVGLGADAARTSLAPYLHQRRTGRAYCLLKTAMSVDGRTAAADGSSRWITGPEARADGHRLRAESQAVVVGAGTALADRPTLTARDLSPRVERQPMRVLLDARGVVPARGPLFDPALAPTLVITTDAAARGSLADAWRAAGAKVETVDGAADGVGVDLIAALELLGRHDVLQALVEGGARLQGAFLRAGLVDRVVAYVGGTVLGERGVPAFAVPGPDSMSGAPRWHLTGVARLGADARLEYETEVV
jgi:diaminohydroxyphosphoribosylaminopyrimidine deaminase / 5-amino-6-(5-phosphoribosylamino)uracil reductase